MLRCSVGLGTIFAILALSLPCSADDSAEAKHLFQEGVAAYRAHDRERALDRFARAYALWPNPKMLPNIGTTAWELGRYPEAAQAYDSYLENAPPDAPDRAEVTHALATVVERVGTLAVSTDWGPSVILLDGKQVGPAGLSHLRVEPGPHRLEAATSEAPFAPRTVEVGAGETRTVRLVVLSPYLEEEEHRTGPTTIKQRTPPVSAPKEQPRASEDRHLPPSQPDDDQLLAKTLPWALGGLGLLGVGVSSYFWIARSNDANSLASQCIDSVCPENSRRTIDHAGTMAVDGTLTLVAGGLALGAAAYLFVQRGRSPRSSLQVAPAAAKNFLGAGASGRF